MLTLSASVSSSVPQKGLVGMKWKDPLTGLSASFGGQWMLVTAVAAMSSWTSSSISHEPQISKTFHQNDTQCYFSQRWDFPRQKWNPLRIRSLDFTNHFFIFTNQGTDKISERHKEGQHIVSAPKESAVSCGCYITYLKYEMWSSRHQLELQRKRRPVWKWCR